MKKEAKLSKSMTEKEFDNGYWYLTELKTFATEIGLPNTAKLRKDEIEQLIKHFLKTGKITQHSRVSKTDKGLKDSVKGLTLDTRIINYTNDKVTKEFVHHHALLKAPKMKKKSGVMYWINRWREDQLSLGNKITYGDLIDEYLRMNLSKERLPQIPSTRFNNFVSDYLANEPNGERQQAIDAWETLKALDIPKEYKAWKAYLQSKA